MFLSVLEIQDVVIHEEPMRASTQNDKEMPDLVETKLARYGVGYFQGINDSSNCIPKPTDYHPSNSGPAQDWCHEICQECTHPTKRNVQSHGDPFRSFGKVFGYHDHRDYAQGPYGSKEGPSNRGILQDDQAKRSEGSRNQWKDGQIIQSLKVPFPFWSCCDGMMQST